MKIAPIQNPHAKSAKVEKKQKINDRDEIIEQTKTRVLEKYGKKTLNKRGAAATTSFGTTSIDRLQEQKDFKLEEKVTSQSESIKLLKDCYLQSYIDFFYLTNYCVPSIVQPSPKLIEEINLNKKEKRIMDFTEEVILKISEDLRKAEDNMRIKNIKRCLEEYKKIAEIYESCYDYETASYFYKRCLDISQAEKSIEGEALSYMGLGVCEEKVMNVFKSMKYHETALEKAIDGGLGGAIKLISKELVRVYDNIAADFQKEGDSEKSLEFYEKCLDACKKANDPEMEAKCYYKIGKLYEKFSDLEKAIYNFNKYLEMCVLLGDNKGAGKAHKKLAESHSQLQNNNAAIKHLEALLNLSFENNDVSGQAQAALKLGLLHYQDGHAQKAVGYLEKHFELVRRLEDSKLVDQARVNLGIAKANISLENFSSIILNNMQSLLGWKLNRKLEQNPIKK